MSQDARRSKRVWIKINVDVRHESKLQQIYSKNLSTGGIYIQTHELIPVGKKVTLFFEIKEINKRFKVSAEVIHHHNYESFDDNAKVKPGYGMGLKFLDLSEQDKDLIEKFVMGKELKQGD